MNAHRFARVFAGIALPAIVLSACAGLSAQDPVPAPTEPIQAQPTEADAEQAMEDGMVTIGELAASPSRLVGEAETYTELLHPSQTNEQALIQLKAEGTLEDGRSFLVDVSYGAPGVEDHTTIELE